MWKYGLKGTAAIEFGFFIESRPWKPNAEGEIRAEHDLQVTSWAFQKLWSFCVVKIAVKSRCYISKSSFIVLYEQPPYKWVQILKVHFTFQVSRLKKKMLQSNKLFCKCPRYLFSKG